MCDEPESKERDCHIPSDGFAGLLYLTKFSMSPFPPPKLSPEGFFVIRISEYVSRYYWLPYFFATRVISD